MSLEEKAVDLLEKLEKVTITLAPQAIEVAEKAMVVSGIQEITTGVLWGLAALVFFGASLYVAKKEKQYYDKLMADERLRYEPEKTFFWAIPLVISSCCFLPFIIQLGCVWNWIAIFQPKLAIANKLLGF